MASAEIKTGIPQFNREFLTSRHKITCIGKDALGGKASGLVFIRDILEERLDAAAFAGITVAVPRMTVICSDVFDNFMHLNDLYELARSDQPDDRIAHAFQRANLPSEIVGDLWALIAGMHTPLAIRSSSMLEDAIYEPFAGVYATKMTPNNQFDTTTRFQKLTEAIKFVYASTFFRGAKNYLKAVHREIEEERMAVIVQEVVGQRQAERFYPQISGVARSYNFYSIGKETPQDGVVELALGLGRTIVDDGMSWSYSPRYPKANSPYNTIGDLMKQTQTKFWAVNMGRIPVYDPVVETEYLVSAGLPDAEKDGSLRLLASSYDPHSDRLYPGVFGDNPRVLTFAPILQLQQIPLNDLVRELLPICEEAVGSPVEMEFAVTMETGSTKTANFGFLQVRPMVVSAEEITISDDEMNDARVLAASATVLGNGITGGIRDVVYVKPDTFRKESTRQIALELEAINQTLQREDRPYLLMGFGRWGSTDPWLGIPVDWGQISGAKAIVESTLEDMNVNFSQGTHFFHNINSFRVSYFSMHHDVDRPIDWQWLDEQEVAADKEFVRHVRLSTTLTIKVDGRSSRGVILK